MRLISYPAPRASTSYRISALGRKRTQAASVGNDWKAGANSDVVTDATIALLTPLQVRPGRQLSDWRPSRWVPARRFCAVPEGPCLEGASQAVQSAPLQ